jgi:hypothetical protein
MRLGITRQQRPVVAPWGRLAAPPPPVRPMRLNASLPLVALLAGLAAGVALAVVALTGAAAGPSALVGFVAAGIALHLWHLMTAPAATTPEAVRLRRSLILLEALAAGVSCGYAWSAWPV